MGMIGMNFLPHDKYVFKDLILVPNEITPIFWEPIPPKSKWSAAAFEMDMIAVGENDYSIGNALRQRIPGVSDGTNNFTKQGFVDIQGWLISNSQPLTADFTATPEQIVDDWIRKIRVPHKSSGDLQPDDVIQTVKEGTGAQLEDINEEDNSQPDGGVATKHPAVINMTAWYDLGAHMFYEKRLYLGVRHGNGIPVGEQTQRYNASMATDISAVGTTGNYAIVIWTASMPHLNAMGTQYDEPHERLAPWTTWEDMIMMYQRAPLEMFEMIDELEIAQANADIREDYQKTGESSQDDFTGLWGMTAGFREYIMSKRQYSVKPAVWEQKPLQASLRVTHTVHAPFQLIPNRM